MSIISTASPDPKLDTESMRIVPLKEAARLKGISEDTLRRHFKHLFVKVSTRRRGMRLKDVLATD
jgi:hypothetical protein